MLRVDLSTRSTSEEKVGDSVWARVLGGKGLGTYLMLRDGLATVDPLSADNELIFAVGPATGTEMVSASRYGVYTRSPLTGIYGEGYSGGNVAPAIKGTGYDAIVFRGVSREPVYVEVSEGGVCFHDASHLWGKDTFSTEEQVLREVEGRAQAGRGGSGRRGAQAVVIGPAGENLVRFACIQNNRWRSAGRCGVGAVMGSKRLKAVAFHGDARYELADDGALHRYVRELIARGKTDPGAQAYRRFGTPRLVALTNVTESFPTRYWSAGTLPTWKNLCAETMLSSFDVRSRACHRCFLACGKLSRVKQGRHAGLVIEGPEYETLYAFGGLCCIDSLEEVAYLNDLCDRLGMDTITAGNLAAFTMEASRQGRVGAGAGAAAGAGAGAGLDYGDAEGVARLLEDISARRGVGAVLAEGIRSAAAEWGMEDQAVHVKGLEPAGYEPRTLKGMALAYATSCRGACHLRTTFYKAELSGEIPPDAIEGKARLLTDYEDRLALFDCMILCRFIRDMVPWDGLRTLIKSTCGLDLDRDDLRRVASDIVTATRVFNIKAGVTRADDTLPDRFFTQPIGEGKRVLKREDLDRMIDDYYAFRGWSSEGVPPCTEAWG